MGDDEVLAAGLADDPRVAAVTADVAPDRAPDRLEDRGGAREVYARELGARTLLIACTEPPEAMRAVTDICMLPVVGPEALTGSTRSPFAGSPRAPPTANPSSSS